MSLSSAAAIADIVSGVSVVLSIVYGFREYTRRLANRVSCWPAGGDAVAVDNQSGLPLHRVKVWLYPEGETPAGRRTMWPTVTYDAVGAAHIFPSGLHYITTSEEVGAAMNMRTASLATFFDGSGRHWVRYSDGRLRRLRRRHGDVPIDAPSMPFPSEPNML